MSRLTALALLIALPYGTCGCGGPSGGEPPTQDPGPSPTPTTVPDDLPPPSNPGTGSYPPAVCANPSADPWDNVHDLTGLPMRADGWTDFKAMVQHPDRYQDCRIVYVSNSTGTDKAGDTYYSPGDALVGNDPFDPVGAVYEYKTILRGYQILRDGKADILLLKRGDVWDSDQTLYLTKGGKSRAEPMIMGAYGSTGDLPKRLTLGSAFASDQSNAPTTAFVLADIHSEPKNRLPGSTPAGLSWTSTIDGLLVEGCRFIGYQLNFVFQSSPPIGNGIIDKVALRRNIVADAWSTSTHSQGIYLDNVLEFMIEENVFDHNGWREGLAGAGPTIFNRNMYLNRSPQMTVRGNIDARGASGGIQQRMGGINERNLCLQNPLNIDFGHAQNVDTFGGVIRQNVVLDSRNIGNTPRGFGMIIGHGAVDVEVSDNIIAHQISGTANIIALSTQNEGNATYGGFQVAQGTVFKDNIVYSWDLNGVAGGGLAVSLGQSTSGVTFEDNAFLQPSGASMMSYITGTTSQGPDSSWIFSRNQYGTIGNSTPFRAGGTYMTFSEWVVDVNESDALESLDNAYPDPSRTIETYASTVDLAPTDYQDGLDSFLAEARLQTRYNYRYAFTAHAVINYIREGFGRSPVCGQ